MKASKWARSKKEGCQIRRKWVKGGVNFLCMCVRQSYYHGGCNAKEIFMNVRPWLVERKFGRCLFLGDYLDARCGNY